jgi:hypothetical protein
VLAQTTTIVPEVAQSSGSTSGLIVFLVTMAIIIGGFTVLYFRHRKANR